MDGSSSQPRTDPTMSTINAFLESLQENTGYWQEPNPHKYPVNNSLPHQRRRRIQPFCGVYGNVMCMVHEGGTRDENYVQWEMIHYQAETGLPFKFHHCWDVLKDSPKWKEIVLPNFNTGSKGGSKRHKSSGLEIRKLGGRDKVRATGKYKGSKASRSSTMNDDALVRLMVTEMTDAEVEQRETFIEIKRGRWNVVNERLQLQSIDNNKKT
ncbi:hypothetical protein Tco_1136733 [Tanacetum coccineum]